MDSAEKPAFPHRLISIELNTRFLALLGVFAWRCSTWFQITESLQIAGSQVPHGGRKKKGEGDVFPASEISEIPIRIAGFFNVDKIQKPPPRF